MEVVDKIKNLNNYEKSIVLNFLKNKNIIYSKNSNGYFFNFKNDDVLIKELNQLIYNIQNNRNIVSDYLKQRKLEQENLKAKIEKDIEKKEQDNYNNFLLKLTIKDENINLNIKSLKKKIEMTELEWTQHMIKIDNALKNKISYSKDSIFYRLNKIIKCKNKKEKEYIEEESDNDDEYDEENVLEEEIIEVEKTEIEEFNETEEQPVTEIDDIEEETEVEEEEIDEDNDSTENTKNIEYNELIKKVKEKLTLKGHVFNRNLDCKLIREEYIY